MTSRWRRMFGRAQPVAMAAPRPSAKFSVLVPPEMLQAMNADGALAPRISREQALQVPAVLRARNLICGSIGKLRLFVQDPDFREITNVTYLVNTPPDPQIAQCVVMAETVEDLLFEGVAWWRVTKFGWHGYPIEAQHVPFHSVFIQPAGGLLPSQRDVTPAQLIPREGTVYIDGRPITDDREIIRFDSPNPPLLLHGARAIRTCLKLDLMVSMYSDEPMPLGYFSPKEGAAELPDPEVQEMLDDWERARRTRAWGYVNAALDAKTLQWNPEQLQLAAQRQHAVLEIARATGVDADYLEAATEVSSETYANSEDKRQDLIDFTLDPYLTAIQQRLSMRDCLPRGYAAQFDVAGFVRGDTKARMETYKVGLEVGAYTKPEIRRLEKKPPLTAAEQAAATPPAPPMPAEPAQPQEPAQQERREDRVGRETVNFAATETTVRVQFEAPAAQDFQVDTNRRTITGLLLPWGKVANNGFAKWRFTEGSVNWSEVNRVKLNLHHDSTDLIGVATRLQSAQRGLMGTFKVGRGPEGDRVLEKAEDGILDGFSVEVDFESFDSWQPDPTDESVRLVRDSTLRGVALTGTPAFDDARLTSVKATRGNPVQKGTNMPDDTGNQGGAQSFDLETFATGLKDAVTETHKQLTTSLGESIGESITAGVKAALENLPNPQGGPEPVRAARYTVTREAPVYPLDGLGHSLVRDAWYAAREHDTDALDRLRKFRMQTEDMAKLAAQVARFGSDGLQKFTTVTTGNASAIIPPGYRPDLFVPMLAQARPLVNAASRGTIANASPFVVPVFGSFTGATADHVEGTNPTDGSLTLTTKTVTPGAISGRLVLTREIVDSSNPAIDQIALNSMMESYNRQTEGKMYTLLNGANGAGGVITAGFVPSGAQAIQSASGAATALPVDIRKALALYPFRRFASPSAALMGQVPTSALASVLGTDNRPLFPSVGAQNAVGLGNAVSQGWFIDGLAFVPAWAVSGVVGATDTHVFVFNALDVWAWESPLLTFRYEEKSGPALIELALFGYFGAHVLRPVGLSGIRMTAA